MTDMYLRFDWSNNCGKFFFRRELVKSILTILKRNISPAKLKANSACPDKCRGEIGIHFA